MVNGHLLPGEYLLPGGLLVLVGHLALRRNHLSADTSTLVDTTYRIDTLDFGEHHRVSCGHRRLPVGRLLPDG